MAETPAERFRIALDLYEVGVRMHRQSLRRRHSDLTSEEIERELVRWLQHRPGAEHGDYPGRLSSRFD